MRDPGPSSITKKKGKLSQHERSQKDLSLHLSLDGFDLTLCTLVPLSIYLSWHEFQLALLKLLQDRGM